MLSKKEGVNGCYQQGHLGKDMKEKKDELNGSPKGHPTRANNKCKCLPWESASSVQVTRRRKWDCSRVGIRGAAGDELRGATREPASRDLSMVRKVDFVFNEMDSIGEFEQRSASTWLMFWKNYLGYMVKKRPLENKGKRGGTSWEPISTSQTPNTVDSC